MNTILQEKINQLTTKVNELRKVVFANLVNWEQVMDIKIGETVLIDETFNTKIYEDATCIIFKTIIPPNVTFPYHLHDFLEQNLIVEGQLEDIRKTYSRNEWMIYQPFEGHQVKNTTNKNATAIVIFTK